MQRVDHILKENKLSITDGRRRILDLFLSSSGALAHADIEKFTNKDFDRVTVYRTLQSFVDKGIIHTIPSSDNSIRYALCSHECSGGHHHDHHIHFVCSSCNTTYCLDDVATPSVRLPAGYTIHEVEVLVKGTCKNCS